MRMWLVVLAVGVGVGGCVAPEVEPVQPEPAVTSEPEPEPTEDPTPGDDIEAGIFCERFIDQRTGTDQEHGNYREYTTSYVNGVWRVAGELADGTPWACGVEPNADASTWTLVELQLLR